MSGKMPIPRPALDALRSSDGRIKATTASGVLALVAALALFAVLPVSAAHVVPSEIQGNPDCTLLQPDDFLFEEKQDPPSDAEIELVHNGLRGSVEVTVYTQAGNEKFDFLFSGDFVAAAVIVKGGPKANLYDYTQAGGADADTGLRAPIRAGNRSFGLSHISFCIDEAETTVEFVCGDPQTLEGDGLFTDVTGTIFANSLHDCTDKEAFYTLEDDVVTLDFDGDGNDIAAGRLEFIKDFGDPADFTDLEYDGPGGFVDVQWCEVRDRLAADGAEFDDVLETDEYPSLDGVMDGEAEATACKVFEGENAAGIQHTVVYFEFVDPNFR